MENLDTMCLRQEYPGLLEHYKENYSKLVKTMTWRADTVWAAQDIVQEAYARCMKYWKSYDTEVEFAKWFSMILNNCLYDYKNEEKGHFGEEFNEELTEGVDCDKHVTHIYWGIDKLIAEKPEHMREILEYHFQQGYTATDISRITEHTYSNIHKIIQRFKEELKEIYGS